MKIIVVLKPGLKTPAQAHLLTVVAHMVNSNGGGAPQDGREIPLRLWKNGKEQQVGSAFIIGDTEKEDR